MNQASAYELFVGIDIAAASASLVELPRAGEHSGSGWLGGQRGQSCSSPRLRQSAAQAL